MQAGCKCTACCGGGGYITAVANKPPSVCAAGPLAGKQQWPPVAYHEPANDQRPTGGDKATWMWTVAWVWNRVAREKCDGEESGLVPGQF